MGILKLFRVEGRGTTGFDLIDAHNLFANSLNKGVLQIVVRRKNDLAWGSNVGVTLILSIEKSIFNNLFSYQAKRDK